MYLLMSPALFRALDVLCIFIRVEKPWHTRDQVSLLLLYILLTYYKDAKVHMSLTSLHTSGLLQRRPSPHVSYFSTYFWHSKKTPNSTCLLLLYILLTYYKDTQVHMSLTSLHTYGPLQRHPSPHVSYFSTYLWPTTKTPKSTCLLLLYILLAYYKDTQVNLPLYVSTHTASSSSVPTPPLPCWTYNMNWVHSITTPCTCVNNTSCNQPRVVQEPEIPASRGKEWQRGVGTLELLAVWSLHNYGLLQRHLSQLVSYFSTHFNMTYYKDTSANLSLTSLHTLIWPTTKTP